MSTDLQNTTVSRAELAQEIEQRKLVEERLRQEIIERKQTEAALRKVQDELELGVQERTAELAKANEALQAEISERRLIEKILRESEGKVRALLEAASIGIVTIDSNGNIVFVNPKVEEIFGYDQAELIGQKIEILLPERFHESHIGHRTNYLSNPRTRAMGLGLDLAGRRKDGSEFPVEIGLSYVEIRDEVVAIGYITDITERVKAEEMALRLAAIVESSDDGIIGKTLEGVITSWNRGAEKIYGYSADEAIGQDISILFPPDHLAEMREILKKLKNGEYVDHYETARHRKDGQQIYVSLTISPIVDASGNIIGASTIARDITERKQAEESLQYRAKFEKIITTLSTLFIYLPPDDIDSGIDIALQTIGEFTGVDRSYIFLLSADKTTMDYTHEWCAEGIESLIEQLQGLPVEAYPWSMETLFRLETVYIPRVADLPSEADPDKQLLETLGIQSAIAIPMIYGQDLMGFLGLISVRTEKAWLEDTIALLKIVGEMFVNAFQRKRTEEALRRQAFYDELTNLPNRVLLIDRLAQAIEQAKQGENYLFAVLFLDLDRFKVINDSLGHLAGDQLLITIARRLETCLRFKDTVARMGGDEFVILLEDVRNVLDAINVTKRIQEELTRPINLAGHEVFTTASIGIVLSTMDDYERPADLLRDADVAMYQAKGFGQTHYEIFNTSMRDQALSRLHSETELRQALEREELEIYYQPIISLTSGQITAVEALIRWQHPQRGLLPPAEIIPLAEETGLIVPIGEWVLRTVCLQNRVWHAAGYISQPIRLAINLSASQFEQQNLLELIQQAIKVAQIPPQALELEITEDIALMKDLDFSTTVLSELSAIGTRISIDDFGLGYSSLACLQRFPINTLKIDRSFVKGITETSHDAVLITAILTMARSLNLKVVAEGVETEEQLAFLHSQGCDEVQGYLLSRPVPAQIMTKLLQEGRSLLPIVPEETIALP